MFTLSSKQIADMEKTQHEEAAATVARFMLETQPAASLDLPEAQVLQLARLWVDKALSWGISSVPLICELFRFRSHWGPFDDAESAWILNVLEGPLTESDKLDYLAQVLYAA